MYSIKVEYLKIELSRYLSSAIDLFPDYDVVELWKTHEPDIPNWAEVCKLILLVQPSSAAAERVFSLLQNAFSRQSAVHVSGGLCSCVSDITSLFKKILIFVHYLLNFLHQN